ncbi:hypothetical protein [Luteococcus sp. OSA5]|uniref:hypothetical protein n=1 Tax=Luteococcus sp. OSA5 TaxID=3401630 RepID=UPI003B430A36
MDEVKVVACKTLDAQEPTPPGWTLTSLDEMGAEAFGELMLRASHGDPFHTSTPESAAEDLRELIEAAGPALDPTEWFAVADAHGGVGVVLPQTFPDDPSAGTLFYLAFVPSRRGEGMGRALHRLGLSLLYRRGARRYVGSTDAANAPMIAIFGSNGCTVRA